MLFHLVLFLDVEGLVESTLLQGCFESAEYPIDSPQHAAARRNRGRKEGGRDLLIEGLWGIGGQPLYRP